MCEDCEKTLAQVAALRDGVRCIYAAYPNTCRGVGVVEMRWCSACTLLADTAKAAETFTAAVRREARAKALEEAAEVARCLGSKMYGDPSGEDHAKAIHALAAEPGGG